LHLGTIYIPNLRKIFGTEILSMTELSICISAAIFLFAVVEIEKRISQKRRFKKLV
jgi:Ca2+-transporting ATPase